jgi:hypothetical protein
MAIANIGTLGNTNEKSADTSITLTVAATAEVGNLVIVAGSMDNLGTSEAQTSQVTVTSNPANTWTKLGEYTMSSGAAADGIVGFIWASVITTQLTGSSGTITATSSANATAKTLGAHEFSIDESAIAFETPAFSGDLAATGDPPSISLSSLPSREYLLLHGLFHEGGSATTADADYTEALDIESTGGAAASNVTTFLGYRIATLTADTADAASSSDRDNVQILVALYEDAGGTDATVNLPAAGIVRLTSVLPAITRSGAVTQPAAGIVRLTAVQPAITRSGTVTQPAAGILRLVAGTHSISTGANATVTQPAAGILRLTAANPAVNASDTVTQPAAGIIRLTATAITGVDVVSSSPNMNPITFLVRKRRH